MASWFRGWVLQAVVALALTVPSCSFVLVKAPKPSDPSHRCSTSNAAPVADLGITLGSVGLGLLVYYAPESKCNGTLGECIGRGLGKAFAPIGAALGAAAYLASAIYGFIRTSQCRGLMRRRGAHGAPHPGAPPPGAPPPRAPHPGASGDELGARPHASPPAPHPSAPSHSS